MSTEPNLGGTGQPAPHSGIGGNAGQDFFGWVRGLGVVRGTDRWAGGVASGLAHRWRIDPVLMRILFVAAAVFLGVGVIAYGILWLVLPEPDGRIHLQDAMHGRWTAGMTGALIATVLGIGGAPAAWSGQYVWAGPFWGLFWAAVVFSIVYGVVYGISSSRRCHLSGPGLQARSAAADGGAAPPVAPDGAPSAPGRRREGVASMPPRTDAFGYPRWQGPPTAPPARRSPIAPVPAEPSSPSSRVLPSSSRAPCWHLIWPGLRIWTRPPGCSGRSRPGSSGSASLLPASTAARPESCPCSPSWRS